jgi:hypothetical protein
VDAARPPLPGHRHHALHQQGSTTLLPLRVATEFVENSSLGVRPGCSGAAANAATQHRSNGCGHTLRWRSKSSAAMAYFDQNC